MVKLLVVCVLVLVADHCWQQHWRATDSFPCGFSVSDLSFKCWCDETPHQQCLARGPPVEMDFVPKGIMLSGNLWLRFSGQWHILCSVIFCDFFFLKRFSRREDKFLWILLLSWVTNTSKASVLFHLAGNLLFSQCPLTVFKWRLQTNYLEMEFLGLRFRWCEFGLLTPVAETQTRWYKSVSLWWLPMAFIPW